MRPPVIDILERCYDVDRSPAAWLEDVARAVQPHIDQGMGVSGYFVDASQPDRVEYDSLLALGREIGAERAAFDAWRTVAPLWFQRAIHLTVPCGFASDLPREPYLAVSHLLAGELQVAGVYGVNGIDASNRGCAIAAMVPPGCEPRTHPDGALMARVAAHLATGGRLVRHLHQLGKREEPEAVLSADGRVEHAAGPANTAEARSALRAMAKRIDRARSRGRRQDDEEATLLWEAMVQGRWTLLDQFESDGKRYVVASVNPNVTDPLESLSPREREVVALAAVGHSNKLIGYELGISVPTVASLLARARKKLGVADRIALIRAYLAHRWGSEA